MRKEETKREQYKQLSTNDALVLLLERSSKTHRLVKEIAERDEAREVAEEKRRREGEREAEKEEAEAGCCWGFISSLLFFGIPSEKNSKKKTPKRMEEGCDEALLLSQKDV